MPPPQPIPAALIEHLLAPGASPFALLRRSGPDGAPGSAVELLTGTVQQVSAIADIPVPDTTQARTEAEAEAEIGTEPDTEQHDVLALVPYRQITERGFACHDDHTPLLALSITGQQALPLDEFLSALPDADVPMGELTFSPDDETYATVVKRVLADEIGRGEGANFVIRRDITTHLPHYSLRTALALFRRLLVAERGAYWTFLVHTGDRTLIGASPETHVRVAANTVTMNPISGTHRYPPGGPSRQALESFLADRKETEELSMVLDEELKMMCNIAHDRIRIDGPSLKEMAHLAHTEYTLSGHTRRDVRDVLKETMFAATVTGSPLENACRVIRRYEPTGRGYYAGALALIGRDPAGQRTLDAPILIRTADIDSTGRLVIRVGATLVRHSTPEGEVAETHTKAAGLLTALRSRRPATRIPDSTRRLAPVREIQQALAGRRTALSPFWLDTTTHPGPAGQSGLSLLVVDAEDAFTAMLTHQLGALGHSVRTIAHTDPDLSRQVAGHNGPVVLGPGPGNPLDNSPAMTRLHQVAEELLAARHPVLGVCLGHEILAHALGLPLVRRPLPYQGAQLDIDLFGTHERVGFYNTFTARADDALTENLARHRNTELSRDRTTGDVHALRGPTAAGVQFHPESVLTLAGTTILARLLAGIR
ncbi:anthranilate synthase family protein [Streptomyces monticola]|uniref:anthranilate synthase n=1 Tax=Streptomyces monticola TaxID=2666263 RepID=A0ABW2JPJ3_9ACTN